ncbi:hypothetical protein BABINDRAFT_6272 [Babjeviella inositovora NRRL Y-12698]|uniref:Major facilitator superfamily (MFS) profile domain-containing protein n=1 Tax=Babjeviella inositovora NRRL Y-12698 TaxID=984486 RepID=A0A1E3QWZ0_9ASCO|nr:uncharacterized protein BABINDRAFT_6272 [Babjeviella inositovora NRRL Y-12698]ODQ81592.1 hypothetical protein BABINDRAFT_6272 [Babjeviella inositovora NRRL Y-12698]
MIAFSTWGANSGFAIYLAYYLETKLFTDSVELYALIGGCAVGLGVIFSPVITYLCGVFGIRTVMTIGAFLQLATNLCASWLVNLWQIVLSQGVLGGFSLALVAMPAMTITPQWFKKRRTLASGIGGAGSGAGGIVYNLAMSKIVEEFSYRWALRAQGIMCFVTVCIAISLIRVRTAVKPELRLFDAQVARNFGAWLVILWIILAMFGYVVLMYNLADFTKSLGYSSHQASVVAAMVSLGALVFRPCVGICSDMFGVTTVNMVVHFVVGVFALAMWIPCRNYATALIFGLVVGGLMGSLWFSVGVIVARIGGLRKFNVFFSMVWVFLGMACMASPVIGIRLKSELPAGLLVDPDQYRNVAIFVGCCYIGSALSLWVLRAWIIARDELSGAESESDNGNEFFIRVPARNTIRRLFAKGSKLV